MSLKVTFFYISLIFGKNNRGDFMKNDYYKILFNPSVYYFLSLLLINYNIYISITLSFVITFILDYFTLTSYSLTMYAIKLIIYLGLYFLFLFLNSYFSKISLITISFLIILIINLIIVVATKYFVKTVK